MSSRRPPVNHSSYTAVACGDAFRVTMLNPDFKFSRRVTIKVLTCAKAHGLHVCFGDEQLKKENSVIVTDNGKHRRRDPLEERVHRFARHIAHGGEHREDTELAELVLLGSA